MERFEEIGLQVYENVYGFCDSHGIVRMAHKLMKQPPIDEVSCERSIICNSGQGCRRWRCPARTLTVSNYARRLEEIDYQIYLLAKYIELSVLRLA